MKRYGFYLETGSVSPQYNLAVEEYVLTCRTESDYLLLWQNNKTVVVGLNQNTCEEIDRSFIERHEIQVVRRSTGGGAVYHDLGNLNYSFITDAADAEKMTLDLFTEPIVNALRKLGLDAEASGRNDILVNGHKVSGTAQRLAGKRILHHGTLLFDTNLDMAAQSLRADPEKYQSKSTKSIRSRICNIRPYLPKDMELQDFWNYLKQALLGKNYQTISLLPAEKLAIETLKADKYEQWDWNYGRSPAYTMLNKCRYEGGSLETRMSIKHGLIEDIRFYGDFLCVSSLQPLYDVLKGCSCRREAVAQILHKHPVQSYFGGITEEEVLRTMFPGVDNS